MIANARTTSRAIPRSTRRPRWGGPAAWTCLVATVALGAVSVGCDDKSKSGAPAATGQSAPAEPGKTAPAAGGSFEGKWAFKGMETIVLDIEPAGKLKVTGLGDKDCVGTYEVKDSELFIKYDAGQSHCENITVGGKLADGGKTLKFGASATYVRK